jgi:hypothetical protein
MTDKSSLLRECLVKVFQLDDCVLALSTGTPGPFRKITISPPFRSLTKEENEA